MASGDHDWTAGEQVTAANVDDYLQLQTMQKHATAAARDTALSARKREGMHTYQDDSNSDTVYSGSAWSTIGPVHGGLTAWTPAVVQLGGVTTTTNVGTYSRVGRRVFFEFVVSCTGSGTGANVVTITLPVTAKEASQNVIIGSGFIFDSSASSAYKAQIVLNTAGTMKMMVNGGTNFTFLGTADFTAALASPDSISGFGNYEAAADA